MFENLKARILLFAQGLQASRNGEMNVKTAVSLGIAAFLILVLVPKGIAQWESGAPIDETLLLLWPIIAIVICLGIAYRFYTD